MKHVKVSARGGIRVPSWAIVRSEGFQKNLETAKRIVAKLNKGDRR